MRLMGGRFVDDDIYETYVLVGVRAILGDDRAKLIINELKEEDTSAHGLIMTEAWQKYASMPDELRDDKGKGIAKLVKEGERLQLGMIEKARRAGVFYSLD